MLMKGGYDKMADDNFNDFDTDVDFADDGTTTANTGLPQLPPQRQPAQQMQTAPKMKPRGQPKKPQVSPQMAVASAEPLPQQNMPMPPQQQAIQQAAAPQVPQARYIPYEMPKRIGLLDRATGKPLIEDEDMLRVIMAQLADIKNDLEEIKSYYS